MSSNQQALLAAAAGAAGDANFANVSVLLWGDVATGAALTNYGYATPVWNLTGAASISGGEILLAGGWLDPTGSDAGFTIGSGAATVEWTQTANTNNTVYVMFDWTSFVPELYWSPTVLTLYNGGAGAASLPSSSSTSTLRCAWTRDGSNTSRVFVEGLVGSNSADSNNYTASIFRIGAQVNNGNPFAGKISNIRVTLGVCRYTANYTPTVGLFPNHT